MIPGARSLGLRLAVFVPEMRVMGRPCLRALPASTLFVVWLSLGAVRTASRLSFTVGKAAARRPGADVLSSGGDSATCRPTEAAPFLVIPVPLKPACVRPLSEAFSLKVFSLK